MRHLAALLSVIITLTTGSFAQHTIVGPTTVVGPSTVPVASAGGGGVTYTITHHANVTNTGSTAAATYIPGWTSTLGDWVVLMPGCFNGATTTIVSATDNSSGGPNTYTQAGAGTALGSSNAGGWNGIIDTYYNLATTHGGATTYTITCPATTFSNTLEVYEGTVSGGSAAFDIAGHVASAAGATTESGPTLTVTGSSGMCMAGVLGGAISQNPKTGNAYTSGGDIDSVFGDYGFVSLIYSTTTSYQAQWTSAALIYGVTNACFK